MERCTVDGLIGHWVLVMQQQKPKGKRKRTVNKNTNDISTGLKILSIKNRILI